MVELWAVLPYCEAMCAHYTGFSDEDIDLLVAQLMGEEPQSQETQSQSNQDRKRIDVYPQQVAPVIVPTFDTSVGVPQFAQGTLERADLEWGYSSQWNPRPIFNTRIESADKPIWRSSMEHAAVSMNQAVRKRALANVRAVRSNSSTYLRFRTCPSFLLAVSVATMNIRW